MRDAQSPATPPMSFPPSVQQLGDAVKVDRDSQIFTVTVSDVHEDAVLAYHQPAAPGYEYISARITYQAQTSGVRYDGFDWSATCAGQAIDQTPLPLEPGLESGTLSAGGSASGYVTFTAPKKGEVRLFYTFLSSDTTATLEVVIRPE